MKYIPADKLIAEIERQNVDKKVIEPLIRIITSLQQEQQEVDLEKYISNKLRELGADLTDSFNRGIDVGKTIAYNDILDRLNVRNEESVGVTESPSKTFPRVNEFDCGSSYRH